MESKQTAVEWLEERYKKNINLMSSDFDQAKEMEKEQMEELKDFEKWKEWKNKPQ